MRWFIIRTIWLREMRDQFRDRRTLLMIVGLPLLLYPLLGAGVLQLAQQVSSKVSLVGVVAPDKHFPPRDPPSTGCSPIPMLACLSATPLPGGGVAQCSGALALAAADSLTFEYPYLIQDGRLAPLERLPPRVAREVLKHVRVKIVFLDPSDANALQERKVDLILRAPASFFADLEKGETSEKQPQVEVVGRPDDDRSRMALRRLMPLFEAWRAELRRVRLARTGLSETFFEPFGMNLPADSASADGHSVIDLVIRIFPFMLVMWSLAGALYPAVDLCAGEKERGTMETLLITPAGREEIVTGKFLTIWVFSAATAVLNLLSMGVTTTQFSGLLAPGTISIAALLWCVVLSLPMSAFFSAISLAIGAYARSSKEGQYYLMPLFLVTMPLIFLTLAPGVKLNAFYSMVPVTGVALLMQQLMTAPSLEQVPWAYFIPVLAPMALYSWLTLRWAIEQFNREEVLFREAERLDVLLWLKRLWREKEPVPTTGEAFVCLGVLIGLRWLSLEMHSAISELAFVAAPPILMLLLLNTRPGEALYLHWPSMRELGLAVLLALLLLPPMAGLAQAVALWFPHLLEDSHPLIVILRAIQEGPDLPASRYVHYFLAFALLPAICEEIAFRGYVLRGLHRRFRPRNAVLLGGFFFALFHMNVFLFLPTFLLGVVLGLLTVRSKSLLPAILFHLLHNSVLIALIPLRRLSADSGPWILQPLWLALIAVCVLSACAVLWWLYRKPYADLERREALERAFGKIATLEPGSIDTPGKS
jgi:sodium transport system permease protein